LPSTQGRGDQGAPIRDPRQQAAAPPGCAAAPSQSAEGGAAPYWESFSYNTANNLTSETSTPASGTATTTTDTYPAAGSAQPHAISSQSTAAPSGTITSSYGYDPAGNLTTITGASTSQTLTWDDAGRLASDATTGGANPGTTSYLYDASGNLLIRTDPGTATLYLSDEEITATTSGTTTTLSGVRYYSIGGKVIADRASATATSPAAVSYLIGDATGTSLLSIDSTSYTLTQRYYDPYGNQIGTTATAWPGDKGFQNGPADTTTGLDNLGAREYNPGTASFISPDPILTPTNPQDLNPYAYAQDTPPTGEDPSGAMIDTSTCIGSIAACTHTTATAGKTTADAGTNLNACSSNITFCVYEYYRAHGGQVNGYGIPTGRGYNPGPARSCGPNGCDVITGLPLASAAVAPIFIYILLRKGYPYYVGQSNRLGRFFEHFQSGKITPNSDSLILETGSLDAEQAAGVENLLVELFGRTKDMSGILSNTNMPVGYPSQSTRWTAFKSEGLEPYDSAMKSGIRALGENRYALKQIQDMVYEVNDPQVSLRFERLAGLVDIEMAEPGNTSLVDNEIEGYTDAAEGVFPPDAADFPDVP
jgi:RHS repeat-associated protein